jgi:homopolymeric O-antigen transport system permease protein
MSATHGSLPMTDEPASLGAPAGAAVVREAPSRLARAGLAWTLVRTDFKARYHGTLSGFAWALLKPAGIFLVLVSVFSFLFTDPTYKMQLVVGLFLWDFFAEGTKTGLASLQAKAFLFKKMKVPLWVLVIVSIANPLITLGVFSVVIVIFLSLAGSPPSPQGIGLFLTYCTALTLFVVAFSLAASVLFLRYRDLNQVWDVVTQAGFFVAPIIYPLGIVPERLHFYFYLWPPTPIIEFSRAALVMHTVPSPTAHLYLVLEVVAALTIGTLIMRRYGRRAAEYA